jgi:hypothetical protein
MFFNVSLSLRFEVSTEMKLRIHFFWVAALNNRVTDPVVSNQCTASFFSG